MFLRWLQGPGSPLSNVLWWVGARRVLPDLCGPLWLWSSVHVPQPGCSWWGAALQRGADHQGGSLWFRWSHTLIHCFHDYYLPLWGETKLLGKIFLQHFSREQTLYDDDDDDFIIVSCIKMPRPNGLTRRQKQTNQMPELQHKDIDQKEWPKTRIKI